MEIDVNANYDFKTDKIKIKILKKYLLSIKLDSQEAKDFVLHIQYQIENFLKNISKPDEK